MNIYHLDIKDKEDHQFDIDYHFSSPTKGASDLHDDFNRAYDIVTNTLKDWNVVDIIDQLENMGWSKVNILTVDVYY